MTDSRRLEIWKRAHAMAIEAHHVSGRMRGAAYLSLRSQLVRAAMSVPTNIVEGREQTSEREFSRFLGYAIASLSELEYHIIIGHDLNAIPTGDFESLLHQIKTVRAMAHSLRKKLSQAAGGQKAGSR